jgi:type II secretory pathway predicted ATPase ExeA
MYEAHYGLRSRPFRPGPDLAAYYAAAPHEEALQALRQAIASEEPFVALTGEPGVGKTLVAQVLLGRVGDEANCIVITNSHLDTRSALLQALLYDLGLPYDGKSEQELRLALTDSLLKRLAEGRRTIVLIDDAQHLPADNLEELRLLTNLESPRGRAVQIVLVGMPDLLDTLKQPWLQALAQRLTTRIALGRLDASESADYVKHQLQIAGARPDAIIADEAMELLVKAGQGIPRVLNQLGHQALMLACQAGDGRVDAEAVLEAQARLGIELPPEEETPSPTAEIDAFRLGMLETRMAHAGNR